MPRDGATWQKVWSGHGGGADGKENKSDDGGQGRRWCNCRRKSQRGQESWTFIYITLGFAISIEGTVISMMPLSFPWNVIIYVIVAFLTGWAWIESGWVQNKLIGLKNKYEDKLR